MKYVIFQVLFHVFLFHVCAQCHVTAHCLAMVFSQPKTDPRTWMMTFVAI